ncbi:RDD family protein [Streptomyces sp. NPDC018321]|uniref:RDD family protein n=1 Tax=unclassified Streptomyces TaxID=2593676 RepID=UPI00378CB2F3
MTGLPHYPVNPNPGPHGAQYYPPQPPYGYPVPYGAPPAPGHLLAPAGLADLGTRLGARVLDVIIWFAGYFVTGVLPLMTLRSDYGGSDAAGAILTSWFVASYLLYFPFCVAEFGSTLGKRICGSRVVRRDTGRNIGFGRALVREISWPVFSLVPVLGLLNSLWCCWDQPYRQCLHDKLPDTVVVDR